MFPNLTFSVHIVYSFRIDVITLLVRIPASILPRIFHVNLDPD